MLKVIEIERVFGKEVRACIDEFLFSFLEPALILQVHGMLQMNVGQSVFGTDTSNLESMCKGTRVQGIVNCLINKPQLLEQLSSFISSKAC